MYPQQMGVERAELIAQCRQLPEGQKLNILESPQVIRLNGGLPQQFHLDEEVDFLRPDTIRPGKFIARRGVVVLFVRPEDEPMGTLPLVYVCTGDRRLYRVPITALSKIPQSPLSEEL